MRGGCIAAISSLKDAKFESYTFCPPLFFYFVLVDKFFHKFFYFVLVADFLVVGSKGKLPDIVLELFKKQFE